MNINQSEKQTKNFFEWVVHENGKEEEREMRKYSGKKCENSDVLREVKTHKLRNYVQKFDFSF